MRALILLACMATLLAAAPIESEDQWIVHSKGKRKPLRALNDGDLGRRRGSKGKCSSIPSNPVACNSTQVEIGEPCVTSLDQLKPTQASVGFMLMKCKQKMYDAKSESDMEDYIEDHVIPGVLGPRGGFYLTDHHHMAKAMTLSKHSDMAVYGCPIGDLTQEQDLTAFWEAMDRNSWVWKEDNKGQPFTTNLQDAIPASLTAIVRDDPFRSFSEWVRDDYGYVKCVASGHTSHFEQCQGQQAPPFLEFKWADLFRKAANQPNIYTLSPREQVQPLWAIVPAMIKLAQQDSNSGMPGFNQDPQEQKPDPPVSIDSDGCEQ